MTSDQVIIHDSESRRWLRFRNPVRTAAAFRPAEVSACLRDIETAVEREGLFAAGFLSYEAAPAFDPALVVRGDSASEFPLAWFGLYRECEPFELPSPTESSGASLRWTPSLGPAEYARAFDRIKRHIADGETYQVNYTFRLRSEFERDPWNFFLEIASAQRADFGAFVDLGRFVLCSASPELFFRLDGRRLESRPMKGTAARALTLKEDAARAEQLRGSEKNRAENVMIVDMIRNDMGRVAALGSVRVPRVFDIERYPTVWQMTSTVASETDAPLSAILRALFPCASITGAPKARSMRIIAELENEPRRVYTGAVGFLMPGRKAQFNVAIRTVLIDRERREAEYGVGGGIVWDSVLGDEYDECLLKAKVLTERRDDFSLFETMKWLPNAGFYLLERHLRRLIDSAAYFGFRADAKTIPDNVLALVPKMNSLPPRIYRVKIVLKSDGTVLHEVFEIPNRKDPEPVKLKLAASPVRTSDVFLYHKTTRRQAYENALAGLTDCDDAVLWNERGEITETTISNLVVELDGELVTPPVSCGLLAGTMRDWLIERGEIRERVVTVERLRHARTIFTVNSVRGQRRAMLEETG